MMETNETLLAQPIFQALGWALLHFLWQGALIALLYASLRVMLQRRAANVRYALGCCALLLMLASPVVTTLIIKRGIAQTTPPPATAPEATAANTSTSWKANATTTTEPRETATTQATASWTAMPEAAQPAVGEGVALRQKLAKALPWLVSIWLAGVLLLSLRVLGGWVMAQRLKNWKTTPATIKWQQTLELLARRLKVSRTVRLCESVVAEVPTVVGWLRPVILVPVSAFTGLSPQQIEALLSHELAHIRRHDYLINLLQTAIETLLFYHPAVWWVSKQIRTEREHCCDDLAVAACGNVLTYARALAELEQLRGHKALPDLAVAADGGGSLLGRIQRLIGTPASPHQRSSAWIASLVAIATIFSICVGARSAIFESDAKHDESRHAHTVFGKSFLEGTFGFSYAQPQNGYANSHEILQRGINESVEVVGNAPQDDEDWQDGTTPPPTPAAPPAPPAPLSPIVLQPMTAPPAPIISLTPRALVYPSTPSAPFSFTPAPAAPAARTFSYGPTPQPGVPVAPRAMQDDEDAEGKPSGSYIDGLAEAGYTNLSVDELIKLRDHGVSPNFLKELKALGYGLPPVEMAIRLADHGVRISYIKKLAEMGYKKLTFEELIRAADHGVRPEVIEALGAAGYRNLSLEQIIRTQDHGVSPTYIKQMAEVGFSNLSLDLLIRMRDHGVGPEYVKEIRAMGYSNISAEQFIRLRDHGVSAAFMRKARERGFNNLSLDELIKLRDADIL